MNSVPPNARITVLLPLAFAPALAQPVAQAVVETGRHLQGSWTAVHADRDGRRADDLLGQRVSFTANRFQIHATDGRVILEGSYRLEPGARPAAIDLAHDDGTLLSKVWKGIYALDGDTLWLCENAVDVDAPRPTAFAPRSGSGEVCITLQRGAR